MEGQPQDQLAEVHYLDELRPRDTELDLDRDQLELYEQQLSQRIEQDQAKLLALKLKRATIIQRIIEIDRQEAGGAS